MDTIVELIKALAIPVVLIIIWIFLRKDIRSLTLPGGAQIDFREPQPNLRSTPALERIHSHLNAKWQNTGNIYWLGHDLMWTIQVLLRGASRSHILYGLKQSQHHLVSIGLADKSPEQRLARVINQVDQMLESDFTNDIRKKLSTDLDNILDEAGAYMEAYQADFEPFAKEYGERVSK